MSYAPDSTRNAPSSFIDAFSSEPVLPVLVVLRREFILVSAGIMGKALLLVGFCQARTRFILLCWEALITAGQFR